MNLLLQRLDESDESVNGELSIDETSKYFTLELPSRFEGERNIREKTCIPAGIYPVKKKDSPHFKREMPHVCDVPDRDDIEIHIANTAADIKGCIGVGQLRLSNRMIGQSRMAFEDLYARLQQAWDTGEEVTIEIRDILN